MKKYLMLIVFLIWCVSPATFLYGDFNKVFVKKDWESGYYIDVYKMESITPYSIYKNLSGEGYFFVLYNKCGKTVFKPSSYYGTWDMGAADGLFFISNSDELELIYAGADSLDGPDGGIFKVDLRHAQNCI